MASSRALASPADAARSPRRRRGDPPRSAAWARVGRAVSAAAVLACLWVLPAGGQSGPTEAGPGVELGLQAGVFAAAGDLIGARQGETFGSVGAARSLALGAVAALRLSGGFVVEAQGAWVPDADLEDEQGIDFGDMDLLTVTAVGLYRPSLPGMGALVQPFLGGGAGLKSYSFDPAVFAGPVGGVDDPEDLGLAGDETDFTLELVAGARVTLLPGTRVRLEARDYLSGFARDEDSEFQNDFAFLAGLGVELP